MHLSISCTTITCIYFFFSIEECTQGPLHGLSGDEWTKSTDIQDPDQRCTAEIIKTVVKYDEVVDSIQTTYRLRDGDDYVIYDAPMMGGPYGKHEDVITLEDGERIIAVSGQLDDSWIGSTAAVINQLTFLISKSNGDVRISGPYGSATSGDKFAIGGNIRSFYGTYGPEYLRGLGAFLKLC